MRMTLVLAVLSGSVIAARLPAAERPNVLVILTDDQGWGDLSLNGNRNLSTPAVDSLARDGAQVERFFVCPVCSPTRAEFLTGRYHPRGNVYNVSTGGERLDLDERTIADVFRTAGYATGCFGKWHNGTQYPYHPLGRGFQEFYGFCSGHWGDYFDAPLEHNGAIVRSRGFLADDLTDHALDFISQDRREPFFCYVPLNTPHSPMQVPDRFYEPFRDKPLVDKATPNVKEDEAFTRAALAMCENLDWNVSRLLQRLDERGLRENTIVVYFCDNGPNGFRWNGGMKGRKGQTDEGGVRSPLLIRAPGKIPAGTRVTPIAGAIDLLPTLAELAGVKIEPGKPLDGMSLVPWLTGGKPQMPERLIFSHWANKISVRSQRYRLDDKGELFDLTEDPGQARPVTKERPAETERLRAAVAEWKRTVLAEMSREPAPFSVGYRKFPITHLPARDGLPHGKIQRSAKAPNCSYFTNWSSVDDKMTWEIEVASAGTYEVILHETCPPEAVGLQVVLTAFDQSLRATIAEPFERPLIGAEHDRVQREGESQVKDFRPSPLGTLKLPAGKTTLTLSASALPKHRGLDVRGLTFTLRE